MKRTKLGQLPVDLEVRVHVVREDERERTLAHVVVGDPDSIDRLLPSASWARRWPAASCCPRLEAAEEVKVAHEPTLRRGASTRPALGPALLHRRGRLQDTGAHVAPLTSTLPGFHPHATPGRAERSQLSRLLSPGL